MTSPVLRACRGLPASGKTTYALRWVADDPGHRVRVNRDDLRAMLHDSLYLGSPTELQIVAAEYAVMQELLKRGISVICDDTNLDLAVITELERFAVAMKASFEIAEFTDVTLEECIRRNSLREVRKPVPEQAIRDMHKEYLAVK